MEQFVLGIFQEHLSKFIVGFRKEQVNANLLNGKGEITDVSLNCAFLNEILAKVTPYIELESVHVSKLSFHVTAWANLQKAPIVIDIEDVVARIVEPLHFLDRSKRKVPQQLTQSQLTDLIMKGLHKLRGAYNLFDRILDNLTVEIRSVQVRFQPRGKFKTRRTGPWTPPCVVITLRHVKLASVNEYGQEGSPDEVWRHNKYPPGLPASQRTLLIYKQLSMECTIGLESNHDSTTPSVILIRDAPVQVNLAVRKRVRDAAIMAVQVDATLSRVEVHVEPEAVPMLAHAMAGMKYCLAKDRAFDEPLNDTVSIAANSFEEGVEVSMSSHEIQMQSDNELDEENDEEDGDNEEDDEDIQPARLKVTASFNAGGEDEASVVSSENDESAMPDDSAHSKSTTATPSKPALARSTSSRLDRPIILLPNGLVIHERICFSLSIHHLTLRGTYDSEMDGYVQLIVKGLIAELMWPKSTGEKGGYAQASLSYVSLQERHGPRIRSILIGGIQHDINRMPLEKPAKPLPETRADENFPLFEDRAIRNDPLDMRHTFPAQAFGLKTTLSVIQKISNPDEDEIMVLQEIGIDRFDVLLDSDAWFRAFRFAKNESGGGFDPRWHSGDWSDMLTMDMLVHPTQTLNLFDYVQTTKQIFLDDNYMISSDLLNVTARITNVELRMPAAVHKDVRSCDLIVTLAETMLIVSSALPRTFLTGKIGSSINGDDKKVKTPIDFPNDPSDICYSLEESEDPSMRQRGTMTSRAISTLRLQLTLRGLSLRVVPVIPFCNAPQAQELLEPTEMTTIVCFEGEPPDVSDSNLIKIVLFISIQIHRAGLNCDFDIMAGAVSTLIHHTQIARGALAAVTTVDEKNEDRLRLTSTFSGRRVLVRRQLQRSRETGGLSIAFCLQVAEFAFQLWRQNVPVSSRFRSSLLGEGESSVDETPIPLLKLLSLQTKGVEIGAECRIRPQSRRVVLKLCLSEMAVAVCNFDAECEKLKKTITNGQMQPDELKNGREAKDQDSLMFELIACGHGVHPESDEHESSNEQDILLRLEEQLDASRSVCLSCDVGATCVVNLHVKAMETLVVLFVEALLMPAGTLNGNSTAKGCGRKGIVFPDRSVGAMFASLLSRKSSSADVPLVAKRDPFEGSHTLEENSLVDQTMHALMRKFLPSDVRTLMLRVGIGDVFVFVPEDAAHAIDADESKWFDANESKWFCLRLRSMSLLTGCFALPHCMNEPNPLNDVLADKGTPWKSLLQRQDQGCHHEVQCRQSLYTAKATNARGKLAAALVPEFQISFSFHPSKVTMSMGDSDFSIHDLNIMKELYSVLLSLADHCVAMNRKVVSIFSALRNIAPDVGEGEPSSDETSGLAPISHLLLRESITETGLSIRAGRSRLLQLRDLIDNHDLQLRGALKDKQREVDHMRYQVFSKERDRLAAVALVASKVSGWIRMGGAHIFGQRSPTTSTMFRYYGVLRKSFLIIYPAPGTPQPIDMVLLEGARLHPLAGGRRKRDVNRGFSIIESGGVVRFFVAESGREFEIWIREIQKAMNAHSPERSNVGETIALASDENQEAGRETHRSDTTSNGTLSVDRSQIRLLATDQSSIGEWRDDESENDSVTNPQRRRQIGRKLSTIASSTKNKLGTAVQVARQKGREVVDTQNHGAAGDDVHVQMSGRDSTQSEMPNVESEATPNLEERNTMQTMVSNEGGNFPDYEKHSSGGYKPYEDEDVSFVGDNAPLSTVKKPQLGQRFAAMRSSTKSKLGSAMQAAKDKGLAVAEQRRKRREQDVLAIDVYYSRESGGSQLAFTPSDTALNSDSMVAFQRKAGVIAAHSQGDVAMHTSDVDNEMIVNTATYVRELQPPSADTVMEQQPTYVRGLHPDNNDMDADHGELGKQITESETSWLQATDDDDLGIKLSEADYVGDLPTSESVKVDSSKKAANPIGRLQIRDKVSKLGAAVKVARRGTVQNSPSKVPDDTKGRFSLRRGFSSAANQDPESFDAADAIKLRSIRIGVGHPGEQIGDYDILEPDTPLKKIAGHWIVQVVVDRTDCGDENGKPVEADNHSGESERTFDATFQRMPSLAEDGQSVDLDSTTQSSSAQGGELAQGGGRKDQLSSQKMARLEEAFRIRVSIPKDFLDRTIDASNEIKEVVRTLSDVLALHSIISEAIGHVALQASSKEFCESEGAPGERRSLQFGISPLDTVRMTGRILDSLLQSFPSMPKDALGFVDYQCDMLMEFLNSVLDCPLPDLALEAIIQFLDLTDFATEGEPNTTEEPHPWRYRDETETIESNAQYIQKITAISSACDAELLRAETCGFESIIREDGTSSRPPTRQLPPPFLEPLLPSKITERLHESMHQALINVMAERDEAQSQLIAASVLHVHEVEQERKKVERLTRRLDEAQQLAKRLANAGAPPFFMNHTGVSSRHVPRVASGRLTKYEEEMVQNSEAELLALCQQLASEISAKTSASLEIIRLKESRKIEREYEKAEKEALLTELKRCKEELLSTKQASRTDSSCPDVSETE